MLKCSLLIKVAKMCRLLFIVCSHMRTVLSTVPSMRMTAQGRLLLWVGKVVGNDMVKECRRSGGTEMGMGHHQGEIAVLL